ncbi:DUF3100 domain-containing protein [Salicibibacter cibarius]|uniref:DUF3100 domain-containing protein n=1 Tax=Salicibibacter cibarius TaxID=2743000 RepID=A0A7T6Z5K0_9BACI|nr:DUF3100 domain-containing protein [Salicibibacter cibarius]QQK77212.1 DUF3100 domain-containing protein [Salicibibacter cibarius]
MEEGYQSIADRVKKEYKIYISAFSVLILSELIGEIEVNFGPGMLILFPLFYGIIIGVLLGPDLIGFFKNEEVEAASPLVLVAIAPFIVNIGITAAQDLPLLISVGPALLLAEFGNLFTVLIALPLALFLGLKREAVGATHSINRETNLALITNVYGPNSPELRGTLAVYIMGGLFGTIFFGFLASLVASTDLFHPHALAIGAGVGAGIMMAAATTSLAHIYPAYADDILALGGAGDMLTGMTGLYAAIFIALPLANKIYQLLEPRIGRKKKSTVKKEETDYEA